MAQNQTYKRQVISYLILPQILPRIHDLVSSGFSNLAVFMAYVFYMVRILPKTHAYLKIEKKGTFGVRHVIAEAANHIVVSRKNIDQLIVFTSILSALVILSLQFLLLILALFSGSANASPGSANYSEFFKSNPVVIETPTGPQTGDLAFRILNLVFGFKGIFGSVPITTTPFHLALQSLLTFYGYGILAIGLLVVLYYVVTLVAETAESGVPFGKRFNHVWAPVRLVIFLGCLIPLSTNGINIAQWFGLNAAKLGSNLATNGWIKFNERISTTYLGERIKLIGKPSTPETSYLVAYMMVAKTCAIAHKRQTGEDVKIYTGYGGNSRIVSGSTTYQSLAGTSQGGSVNMIFGVMPEGDGPEQKSPDPVCGEIIFPTTDASEPGSAKMQQSYFNLVRELWDGKFKIEEYARNYSDNFQPDAVEGNPSTLKPLPDEAYKNETAKKLDELVSGFIDEAVNEQIKNGKWAVELTIREYGWGGAGIWYNKIAQMNGAVMASVRSTPRVHLMPEVIEKIRKHKLSQDANLVAEEVCNPMLADGKTVPLLNKADLSVARAIKPVCTFWTKNGFRADALASQVKLSGNIIIDAINMLFGTQGVFNLCKNSDIHPLAQLSMAGRGLIESSVAAFGGTIFFGATGTLARAMGQHFGVALQAVSGFFTTIAGIGLTAGFVLFYVVPFMPFIYFFFALAGWIKCVFEAMIGIPLWVLGHLHIDSDGMFGDKAEGGYFLIFEIFLRPIMIIFGLLASITIFAATVRVLNEIFYLVIANMSGHDPASSSTCFKPPETSKPSAPSAEGSAFTRGTLDEFFYTIVYAIIVYMVGMSSFKMIDMIPNNVMRWLGAGVSGFGKLQSDPTQDMMKAVTAGGSVIGGQLKEGAEKIGGGVQSLMGRAE